MAMMLPYVPHREPTMKRGVDAPAARIVAVMLATVVVLLAIGAAVWAAATLPPAYEVATAMAPGESRAERSADEHAIAALREYLSGASPRLDTPSATGDSYFNGWERRHLRDVRARFAILPVVVAVLAGLVIALAAVLAAVAGARGTVAAAATGYRRVLRVGAGLGGGVLLACLLAFPTLWNLFHLALFTEPTWVLDPARDRLLQLFPLHFWASLGVAIAIVVAAALAGLAVLARRLAPPAGLSPGNRTSLAVGCAAFIVLIATAAASLAWPLGTGAVACRTLLGDSRRADCAHSRTFAAASRIGESKARHQLEELLRHDRRLRAAIDSEAPDRSNGASPTR